MIRLPVTPCVILGSRSAGLEAIYVGHKTGRIIQRFRGCGPLAIVMALAWCDAGGYLVANRAEYEQLLACVQGSRV